MTYEARIQTVTPDMALEWLTQNTLNRNPKQLAISRYAQDMKAGRWHMTGEPIKFSEDGVLLDGQNRLYACISAEVPFESLVVTGLDVTSQQVMDTGVKRGLSDVLKIGGYSHTTTLAQAITFCARYEVNADLRKTSRQSKNIVTGSMALQWMDRNPRITELLQAGERVRKHARLSAGIATALMYVTSEIDAEDSSDFWTKVEVGSNLEDGSPILALRASLHNSDPRYDNDLIWAYVVKAWNFYRNGTEVKVIRWYRGGVRPEAFPIPA